MCYNYKIKAEAREIQEHYDAVFDMDTDMYFDIDANGFAHPVMPVITNHSPHIIQAFTWGLIPSWVKSAEQAKDMENACLLARYESIHEKPSFRDSAQHKRCLIPATSFVEHQWTDLTKKNCLKIKYEIDLESNIFSFAGLWSEWHDREHDIIRNTFCIIMAEANELMSEIHNSQKRMPLILRPDQEKEWLQHDIDVDMQLPLRALRA